MKTTLFLATALLSASILVPAASAGFADEYAPAPAACDINQPPVDYVLCLLGNPDPHAVIQRVKDEAAWQQTAVVAAVNYYNGVGNAVYSSTLDFGNRQLTLTTVFVGQVQSGTYGYVNYVAGVPFAAATYTYGVLDGECRFWVNEYGCPVWATASDSTVGFFDGTCDPTRPVLQYVICEANEIYWFIDTLADRIQAHYTTVALGAADFAIATTFTFYGKTVVYALNMGIYGLFYGYGTAGSALVYAGDVQSDVAGVPAYTTNFAYAECGRVWSQCPRLTVTADITSLLA